jgi:hypothetical protein
VVLSEARRAQRLASVVEGLIERAECHLLIKPRTVPWHEAMAVRSVRLRMVAATEIDFDAREAVHTPGPDEYATALERAHRSLAVLAELDPAEPHALLLQAAGRTYAEIESATGVDAHEGQPGADRGPSGVPRPPRGARRRSRVRAARASAGSARERHGTP